MYQMVYYKNYIYLFFFSFSNVLLVTLSISEIVNDSPVNTKENKTSENIIKETIYLLECHTQLRDLMGYLVSYSRGTVLFVNTYRHQRN